VCGEIYPSPAPESSSPSQTRTCMGPFSDVDLVHSAAIVLNQSDTGNDRVIRDDNFKVKIKEDCGIFGRELIRSKIIT
jgi:hypothetical protein